MPNRVARDHVLSHPLACYASRLGMFRSAVRHVSWCGVLAEACLMKLNDYNMLNDRLLRKCAENGVFATNRRLVEKNSVD